MLVTHWGLSGPVILRLSAWGARYLSSSDYKGEGPFFFSFKKVNKLCVDVFHLNMKHMNAGILYVDFTPNLHIENVKSILIQHKNQFVVIYSVFYFLVLSYEIHFFTCFKLLSFSLSFKGESRCYN